MRSEDDYGARAASARTRRYRAAPSQASATALYCGATAFDLELHVAFVQGDAIGVRPREARLLSILFSANGRLVAYQDIERLLYGARISPETSRARLKSLVADVRRRFGSEVERGLVTVPSRGLVLYSNGAAGESLAACSPLGAACAALSSRAQGATCRRATRNLLTDF